MKKNVIWLTLMITVLTFLVIGCGGRGGDKQKEIIKPPPSAWDIAPTAYSDLIFKIGDKNNSSWVGLDGFPLGRWDAQWLGKEPGFSYYDGHQGGEGDTLEITSATNGMDFKWAHQQLNRFDLFKGWKGQIITDRGQPTGICLGSPATDFWQNFLMPNRLVLAPMVMFWRHRQIQEVITQRAITW